jgi:hypothetical protein
MSLIKKWPNFRVPIKFRMKSCKQALNEGNWGSAGQVQTKVEILQDSNPFNKRRHAYYNTEKQRIDTGLHDFETTKEMQTTYYQEAIYPPTPDWGFGFEGAARSDLLEAAATLRGKPANYDLPIEEIEWETVWDGGPV